MHKVLLPKPQNFDGMFTIIKVFERNAHLANWLVANAPKAVLVAEFQAKEGDIVSIDLGVTFEGYVTDAADPWLTLLGSRIDTTSIPESGFRGRSGTIGRSTFFAGLGTAEQVTLQGRVVGTQVVWTAARRAR